MMRATFFRLMHRDAAAGVPALLASCAFSTAIAYGTCVAFQGEAAHALRARGDIAPLSFNALDVALYALQGCEPHVGHPGIPFSVPIAWVGLHLFSLAGVLAYIASERRGVSDQILVRSGSWRLRNVSHLAGGLVFAMVEVATMAATWCICSTLLSNPVGAHTVTLQSVFGLRQSVAVIAACLSCIVAVDVFFLALSIRMGAVGSFGACTVWLLCSAYLDARVFPVLASWGMTSRIEVSAEGYANLSAVIVLAVCLVAASLIASIAFNPLPDTGWEATSHG